MTLRSHAAGIDPEKVRAIFERTVRELDAVTVAAGHDGSLVEGDVSGGDWVGDDRDQANSFGLTAADVRGEQQ